MAAMSLLLSLLCLFTSVLANTEKTIFLGPDPVTLPLTHPTLSDLRLHTLTHTNGTLRTQLNAQFPSSEHPHGPATWLILDNLTPKQRYEVRVCWPATQPTEFSLSTFSLSTVWDTPELIASLHAYTTSRRHPHDDAAPVPPKGSGDSSEREASILLLRILAAADYFTTDASLMSNVPPVDVDVILDPFLYNVLPRSIAGTAIYIVGVAIVGFLLAGMIASSLQGLVASSPRQESVKKRQ
ncbi:hypothetical protein C8A00DRAFT_44858 [Chaetomidium leptoderma]|uniref:Uncharacterized protein n=1 Tax=Chaetomidium leptoderma TaxID=669021 RepID=A0AAN6VKS6_9PEZI|nr:hypothetical protein C8A00DRAFT_44858 [Chaetomidium leptoderma]